MKKPSELELFKYWLDSELTILHIMFAVILWQLTEGFLPHFFIFLYIVYSVIYAIVRMAYVASHNKDYLKVPKKWPH